MVVGHHNVDPLAHDDASDRDGAEHALEAAGVVVVQVREQDGVEVRDVGPRERRHGGVAGAGVHEQR